MDLDIYATHLSNDSVAGFKAAIEGEHKPVGDYWMVVGNCNAGSYEDSVKPTAPVAANINNGAGNYEVYGDSKIEFKNVEAHDVWKSMINQNMEVSFTYTAVLSRYKVSDSAV